MAILCLPTSCIKAADISSYPTLTMSFMEPQSLLAALQCTQEYGPVFSFRQGVKTIIVVGRFQVAVDIMEKEGAALTECPRSMAAGETLSSRMRVLLTSAGEQFKKMWRALHSHLQPKSIASYSPTLMKTARQNMLDIVQDPERCQDHAKWCLCAAVVMDSAYSKLSPSYKDPKIRFVDRCLIRHRLTMRAGAQRDDIFSFLGFVPEYIKPLKDGHTTLFQEFGTRLKNIDDETAYLTGSMFRASSDTMASKIGRAVMAATCYPETQKKVQEELDTVIGKDRHAFDILPQTMAFMLESFRWRPVMSGRLPS
ncbi:cytochrome P450 [Armillaria novae-zelandiae]|uniref:Cytochrome P450 n=1 Tax=Armillaria novae-zelandiae TaxID=153914 RepID=A0AA39U6V3_9AGAR|nr:cytochrome P450 [Armillaria novae-zelandiae]